MGLVDGIARVHGAATNLKAPKLLDKKFQKNAEELHWVWQQLLQSY